MVQHSHLSNPVTLRPLLSFQLAGVIVGIVKSKTGYWVPVIIRPRKSKKKNHPNVGTLLLVLRSDCRAP
ncbi:hypothetical protein BDW42DRAFT_176766 [Aspergillus taichungensis]|uniref:Uncharacterized protein n=1 Tax=Aspergillus taichungensis TaxID=482145 RepID=A0A2J5HK19_9EURO|nr:hypothetical protein BDW42DRAFT_176766 [Aspergillus taichungensis]